jgi:glycosyltransferase involved in cell wall biosynthesis
MKKILILAKTIDGGTGTYLTNLLQIKKMFGDAVIISVAVLEKPIFMTESNDGFLYMKKRDYSFDKYTLSYKNLMDFIKELIWIRKIIRKVIPDIILGVDVNCNIHIGLNKLIFKERYRTIFTTHSDLDGNLDQRSTKFLKAILKKIIRFFYSRSDSLICVSAKLTSSLQSGFRVNKKIRTIFNGLDIDHNYKETANKESIIILTVARLDKQKDCQTLLKAFELINNEMPNLYLWIVGDGPLKEELMNLVKEKNLDANVKFLGWQKELREIFRKSSVFILSSNREGFPYALIEAMSYGLPVVCTNTPYGPSEILDDGKYGFLVPMKDHLQMKKAVLELLGNRSAYKTYSQLALERSKLFTSDRMVNDYANEISKLL